MLDHQHRASLSFLDSDLACAPRKRLRKVDLRDDFKPKHAFQAIFRHLLVPPALLILALSATSASPALATASRKLCDTLRPPQSWSTLPRAFLRPETEVLGPIEAQVARDEVRIHLAVGVHRDDLQSAKSIYT